MGEWDYCHISVMNDVVMEEGKVEVKFKFNNNSYNGVVLYFKTDEHGDGYALKAYCYTYRSTNRCYLELYKSKDWVLDWDGRLASSVIVGFDVNSFHTIGAEFTADSITAYVDTTSLGTISDSTHTKGGLALGTYGLNAPLWFDDLSIQGTATVRDYSDPTKTLPVMIWAIEFLGNMASETSDVLLEAIISDREPTPFSSYLKRVAEENLAKSQFIRKYPLDQAIELGLTHNLLCIRKWALDALIKETPYEEIAALIDRFNQLFTQAMANNDQEFASYIAEKLEYLNMRMEFPPLEILEPVDGTTTKRSSVKIVGRISGRPFYDTKELVQGENTYTKTITDDNKNVISESITIYSYNDSPVLNPLGDKEVLVGETLAFTVSASDPDDTNLLYFVYSLPEGANFDYETQTLSWTPRDADIGNHTVRFVTDDGFDLIDKGAWNLVDPVCILVIYE